ncbi:MAG: hypothetical protein ACRERR_05525 [Moraxellaceae bacterium]
MILASRLRSLMPALGLLMAAAVLLHHKPSAQAPWVMGGLGLFLLLLWLVHPASYGRVHVLMGRALQGLAALITLLVLLFMYFMVLTPIALLMRLGGRDQLHCRVPPLAVTSEWRQSHSRDHDKDFFRSQF